MNRSRARSVSYGLVCAASAAALTGIAAGCDDDEVVVGAPVEAGAGGAGAAGSGGTGGTDGAAGSGGTAGDAGTDGAAGTEGGATVQVAMANLVSDQTGVAGNADPKLINPWGLAINPNASIGPVFWVANEGSGTATTYDQTGKPLAVTVTIPVPGNATAKGSPTGQIFNDSPTSFLGDLFILSTIEGAIVGWKAGAVATVRIDSSASEASYTGLAMVEALGSRGLVAADFHNNKVDAISNSYSTAAVNADAFKDATMPSDFAPFNVAFIDSKVYVAYAKQDADKEEEETGAGLGYISVFEWDGRFVQRLVTKGALDAPWAMATAPASFGSLAGSLLVGNFGDGKINAYDKLTGAPRGQLMDASGQPLVIEGLWALVPGPAATTGATAANAVATDLSQTLYFTAGPDDETHGVFGAIRLK
jgi:uncharacterized protein (TIGR03118 family)